MLPNAFEHLTTPAAADLSSNWLVVQVSILNGLVMDATFTSPSSYRLTALARNAYDLPLKVFENTHESHPSLDHLVLLVFEAVLEVVCVSLPGYIVARLGHFDADKQKFLANLNVMLFTPCLSTSVVSTPPRLQLTLDSLYETRFPAQCREVIRSRRHSRHLHRSNLCIMGRRHSRCQGLPL